MALLFIDGFDLCTTASDIDSKWNYLRNPAFSGNQNPSNLTAQTSVVRYSTTNSGALEVTGSSGQLVMQIHSNQYSGITSLCAGVAIYFTALPTGICPILEFTNTGSITPAPYQVGGIPACFLCLTPSGKLQISAFDPTFSQGTGTTTLSIDTWYYVEFQAKATFPPIYGSTFVNLNGVPEIVVPHGFSDSNPVDANFNQVLLGPLENSGGTFYFDDFYLASATDGSSAAVSTPGNVVMVQSIVPIVDTSVPWFRSSLDSGFASVGAVPAAGSNITGNPFSPVYIASGTVGQVEVFGLQGFTIPPHSVVAAQFTTYAQRNNAVSHTLAPCMTLSGVNYVQSAAYDLQHVINDSAYAYYCTLFATNPVNGSSWLATDFSAASFGFELQS